MSVESQELIDVLAPETDSEKLDRLCKSHDEILALLESISIQVMPVIESLKDSPILKMMGVK